MVLSRMDLLLHPAHSRSVCSHQHKQVLGVELERDVLVDDFDVGQVLPIGTHFILALDNEGAAIAKHATRLHGGFDVKR